MLYIWLRLTAITALLTAPIAFFGRRRVLWRSWELSAFVLPYVFWLWLDSTYHLPKSLANIGELGVILISVPIAASTRVLLGSRILRLPVAIILQVLLLVVIGWEYFSTPMLPE